MCQGISGRIVEVLPGGEVARVDVAGVVREINIAMLDGGLVPGDYILVHSGFALERMTAEQVRDAADTADTADAAGTDDTPDGPAS